MDEPPFVLADVKLYEEPATMAERSAKNMLIRSNKIEGIKKELPTPTYKDYSPKHFDVSIRILSETLRIISRR